MACAERYGECPNAAKRIKGMRNMETENIEVVILSAKKETDTLYSEGKVVDIITSSVSYDAFVNIPNARCEIKGTFKFKDTEIMHEGWIRGRIAGFFKNNEGDDSFVE